MSIFFKMAAGSHFGFHLGNIRPPTKCNYRFELGPQIWCWSDLLFLRYCDFYILAFWLEIAYSRPFFGSFGGLFPPNVFTHRPNPQKALPCAETRRWSHKANIYCIFNLCYHTLVNKVSHKAWKSVEPFDLGAGSRKKGKDRTGQDSVKKSQSGNISPIWGEAPLHRLKPKFARSVISPM